MTEVATAPKVKASELDNLMRGLILAYGPPAGTEGPEKMIESMWGVEPDRKQLEALRGYADAERGITIRSGHGVGKTAVLSWCAINQILCRYPQKTVITAPSAGQLFDALYVEMVSWIQKLPQAIQDLLVITATRITLAQAPEDSFISFRTARADAPEALQGVHSEHVLLIGDEASGIPEAIFEAAIGSMSGHTATTMLASNPTKASGFFYNTHMKPELAERWHRIHISCEESKLVSDDFEQEVASTYGRDSNAYRIRFLGEFPEGDSDAVIPRALVDASFNRDIQTAAEDPVVWGLDVARFGSDLSVLVKAQGNEVVEIHEWGGLDTMQLTGRIAAEYDEAPIGRRPKLILVDVIGLGSGVVDRLRELKYPVRGINTSESPSSKELYANLRAELWFKGRDWFLERKGRLPDTVLGRKMADQLCLPTYTYTSTGKKLVESKDSLVKRGHKSPNHADAFILTLAASASTMILGRKFGFGQPLRRNLKRIV